MFCRIKYSWIRTVTACSGVCSTSYQELKLGSVGWDWLYRRLVGFQVLKIELLRIPALWDMPPCLWAIPSWHSFDKSGNSHSRTWHRTPEDLNPTTSWLYYSTMFLMPKTYEYITLNDSNRLPTVYKSQLPVLWLILLLGMWTVQCLSASQQLYETNMWTELPATAYVSSWRVLVLSKKIFSGVLLILPSEPSASRCSAARENYLKSSGEGRVWQWCLLRYVLN